MRPRWQMPGVAHRRGRNESSARCARCPGGSLGWKEVVHDRAVAAVRGNRVHSGESRRRMALQCLAQRAELRRNEFMVAGAGRHVQPRSLRSYHVRRDQGQGRDRIGGERGEVRVSLDGRTMGRRSVRASAAGRGGTWKSFAIRTAWRQGRRALPRLEPNGPPCALLAEAARLREERVCAARSFPRGGECGVEGRADNTRPDFRPAERLRATHSAEIHGDGVGGRGHGRDENRRPQGHGEARAGLFQVRGDDACAGTDRRQG